MSENKIIVTIGREFGSGGHEIAKRLAKDLGIAFYDEEFISMAVKNTGFNEEYIRVNEEKAPDFAAGALFAGVEYYQSSPFDRIQEEEYKIIKEVAAKGSCVIVGRAADYVLADQSHVSVFVYAPLEDRVSRKMALVDPDLKRSVSRQSVEKLVKKTDKQRRRYYEYYTDKQWGDKESYDLLINTSRTGIDGAVKIIKTYIDECRGESMMPD